jgi:polar amino acid transport system substrate-binding protein
MLARKFVLLFVFFSLAVFAEPVLIDIRHRPPEMSIVNEQFYGPLKQVVTTLLFDSELEPICLPVPWPRTLQRAKMGKVDLIPRHSMTKERESFLLPMLLGYEQRSVRYLLGPHIKDISEYTSTEQFSSLTLGLLRGSYYGPFVENIDDMRNIVFVNDIKQLMSLLLVGRIDVMPIQNLVWAEKAFQQVKHNFSNKQYQLSDVKESFVSGKYISIAKSSLLSNQFHLLNCTLYNLRNSGVIDDIYQQHSVSPYIQLFDTKESLKQQESCINKR